MKLVFSSISELIEALENIRSKYGDLDVRISTTLNSTSPISSVEITHGEAMRVILGS